MRGNPNPKPFPPGKRGHRPKMFGDEKTTLFQVLLSDSIHRHIMQKGGSCYLRKLIFDDMKKNPVLPKE